MNKPKGTDIICAARYNAIYRLTRLVAHIVLPILFEIRVEGRENIAHGGPFVLLPKHQRWMDVPLIGLTASTYLYYIAKAELFSLRLGRWFISAIGGIPLNRRRPMESRQSLLAIRDCLQREVGLVLFPEGTYYPGRVGPGHRGMFRFIVSSATVPLIPVGIRYRKQWIRTTVRICFGEPIIRHASDPPETVLNAVMDRIADLSGLARPQRTA
jgi:1-acyl-sn-glycerol-3-phosphate acyltransferase